MSLFDAEVRGPVWAWPAESDGAAVSCSAGRARAGYRSCETGCRGRRVLNDLSVERAVPR